MTYGVITWLDASKEKASVTVNLPPLLADGSNYAAITADFAAIVAAFDGITDGNLFETAIIAERTRLTNAIPSIGDREDKLLVRMEDDTTKRVFSFELPCRQPRGSGAGKTPYLPGTDFVDVANVQANVVALVAAVNDDLRSPGDPANGVTLLSAQAVGRNI